MFSDDCSKFVMEKDTSYQPYIKNYTYDSSVNMHLHNASTKGDLFGRSIPDDEKTTILQMDNLLHDSRMLKLQSSPLVLYKGV